MKALTSLLMSLYILSFILCNVTSNANETVELNQTAGGDSKEETEEEKNARILREDIKKALTATDADAEKQWNEAEEQIRGYARGKVVRQMIGGTELHLIIAQIRGYDLLKLDKVDYSQIYENRI